MNEDLRRRYIRDLMVDLEQVGGARFEILVRPLWDHLAGAPVIARGLNREGVPVAGALDGQWPDGSASEASSEKDYFARPFKKARNDFAHIRREAPGCRTFRFFSTREAPPRTWKVIERYKAFARRRGFELDVWDGRRIAEFIVDRLLIDGRFVERVGDTLPNIRRIAEQNAASQRVPPLDPSYVAREAEQQYVVDRLRDQRSLVVWGMGGVGKTEFVCAIAHRVRENFELVIWVDGDRVTSVQDLDAFDVRLNGYRLNIRGLLQVHRTLLIVDGARADLDIRELTQACAEHSRVLITSQVQFGDERMQLDFLSPEHANAILSANVQEPCPGPVFEKILAGVGGHPLVLRMLNQHVRAGHSWLEAQTSCEFAPGFADDRRRTVAERILQQHLEVLRRELALFAWCGSPAVDAGFLHAAIGSVGLEKLERWALLARSQSDAIRMHDLVYSCVRHIRERLDVDPEEHEARLEQYIASTLTPKSLHFFRVINRHRDLIRRMLTARPRPGALRYAYIHGHEPRDLDPTLMGDPMAEAATPIHGNARVWMLSLVETIEGDYRRIRDLGDRAGAQATLVERMPLFERLRQNPRLGPEEQAIVRHHHAKALLKLGRAAEAQREFEQILEDGQPHYATRLQLARLYRHLPERARELIFEIISAEATAPGSVALSVLVETLSALRLDHLRPFVGEITEQYGPLLAQQIKAAACSGETHPFRAFAGLGAEWAYRWPDLFMEVFEEIEPASANEAEDDDELLAFARILNSAGKVLARRGSTAEALVRWQESLRYFNAMRRPSAFSRVQQADVLLLVGSPADAAAVLDGVAPERREVYWQLRRAQAHLALGERDLARGYIEDALARGNLRERRSTFLATKSDIQFASGDQRHLDTLRQAIDECVEPQYRQELEAKLRQRTQPA